MFGIIFLETWHDTNIIDGVLQLFSFELRSALMIEWGFCCLHQTGNMFMIVTVNSSQHQYDTENLSDFWKL